MLSELIRSDQEFLSPLLEAQPFLAPPCGASLTKEFNMFVSSLFQPAFHAVLSQLRSFVLSSWLSLLQRWNAVEDLWGRIRSFIRKWSDEVTSLVGSEVKDHVEVLLSQLVGEAALVAFSHETIEEERILFRRMCVLQFVQPKHLDLSTGFSLCFCFHSRIV